MKEFNLDRALAGEPVVTRNGKCVSEIHHFLTATPEHQVAAIIEGDLFSFHCSGRFLSSEADEMDLFMAPVKKQEWANIYYHLDKKLPTGQFYTLGNTVYESEEAAIKYVEVIGAANYMKSVLIREWEE